MQQQASGSLCMSEPNHEVAAVVAAAERKWMRPKDHIAIRIAVFDKRKEKKE